MHAHKQKQKEKARKCTMMGAIRKSHVSNTATLQTTSWKRKRSEEVTYFVKSTLSHVKESNTHKGSCVHWHRYVCKCTLSSLSFRWKNRRNIFRLYSDLKVDPFKLADTQTHTPQHNKAQKICFFFVCFLGLLECECVLWVFGGAVGEADSCALHHDWQSA